jgi:ribosomal protein S18 acetylase RimI-like enzyme
MVKNYNKITINDPKLGDEMALVSILEKTWLATYQNKKYKISKKDILSKIFFDKKRISRWRKTILENKKKSHYICVARIAGEIIGFCLVTKGKKNNELNTIYVLPEYQNMGVGKKLLGKTFTWLGNKKDIIVMVAVYNKKAIYFYKKNGFCKTDVVSSIKLPSGKIIPEIQLKISK